MDLGEEGLAEDEAAAAAAVAVDDEPPHAVVVVVDDAVAEHNDVAGAVVEPQVEEVVDDGQSHVE